MKKATHRGTIPRTAALLGIAAAGLLSAASPARAGETWGFDISTTGQDVSWSSPTSVDPGAAVYATGYQITLVEVDVTWFGIPFNDIDVTNQVPPDLQTGTAEVQGPAPISILDQSIVVPEPPEPPALSALLSFGLDASGTGFASATQISLGTLDVDLGPLGVQTVTIVSVRLVGQLTVHGAWFDLGNALAGTPGLPALAGSGALAGGDPFTLTLTNARPSSVTLIVIGVTRLDAPFAGGVLVPALNLVLAGIPTGPTGTLPLGATWPLGVPADTPLYFQIWILDPAGPSGLAASNGLQAVAQ